MTRFVRFGDALTDLMSSGMFALTLVGGIAGGVAIGALVLLLGSA